MTVQQFRREPFFEINYGVVIPLFLANAAVQTSGYRKGRPFDGKEDIKQLLSFIRYRHYFNN
jgi:hypothetical protein